MDVEFRPISSWQKKSCINQSSSFTCTREATLEASIVLDGGAVQAGVRCCDHEECMARAAEMARASVKSFLGIKAG